MKLTDQQLDTARAIVAHESDDFLTLARAAGLTAPDVWEGADLRGVRVAGDVAGMSFRRSDLRGADLRGARGLTAEAIADAITDAETLGLPHPPDFSIDRVKRMVLAGERVPEAWVPFVKVLDLSGMGLTDLSPLAGLTALISLDLSHRWVVDTEQPRKLLGRRAYSLDGLAEIISIANIDYLFDQNLQILNLSPLAGLVRLSRLDLHGTKVSDLSPLAGLSGLAWLDLSKAPLSDISPLAGLKALTSLGVSGATLSNMSPLAGLTALTRLYLSGTRVSDASPLAGLARLQTLRAPAHCDTSALEGRSGLRIERDSAHAILTPLARAAAAIATPFRKLRRAVPQTSPRFPRLTPNLAPRTPPIAHSARHTPGGDIPWTSKAPSRS